MAGGRSERTNDLFIEDDGLGNPSEEGQIRHTGGDIVAYLGGQVRSLTTGTGMNDAQHRVLRQLIHFIETGGPAEGFASGAFRELLPSGDPFPTSMTWYTDNGKTDKIVDLTITYNGNKTVSTEQWRMYDTDGSTVLATITDTMSYSGVIETSRTRTIA